MAVTCGFFNALEHDRLYDAIQMSSIFDGIIRDGIFSTIGTSMAVTASGSGLVVNVGAGRAWFNHTWILNDTQYPVEAEAAEVVLDRIDAVVIEINQSAEIRDCSIKFIKGTPSSRPVRPTMIHNAEVNQYALAYVSIRAGQTTIFQADITSVIGNDETPFVTGLLQQTSIESIVAQWQDEFYTYFNNFRSTTTSDFNTWMAARVAEYNAWYAAMEAEGQADLAEFDSWFQEMKDQLSEDAAGHLQAEIDALELSAEKGSVVIVTTSDDTLINHACTISQGSAQRNATFDINKKAIFESIPFVGDMNITATNGTLIASKNINIPYFGRYNYDLEFWEATLAISSSSTELYERPITIAKGGITVGTTSFDNTGHATFKVHEPGTYTITSTTTGGAVFTANVEVTAETSYPVDLGTPIGRTALPTDDIQLWLKCGGEYDCNYTTLAEVLADTELFARLCADSNACDYMARSTTWASGVAADSTAMLIVGKYNYCANALLSNSTWASAIGESSYKDYVFNIKVPTMTSATAPSGTVDSNGDYSSGYHKWKAFNPSESYGWVPNHSGASAGYYLVGDWLSYDFGFSVCINYVELSYINNSSVPNNIYFKIQGSNDDFVSDIHDLCSEQSIIGVANTTVTTKVALGNATSYAKHRVYISTDSSSSSGSGLKVQFYGRTKAAEYIPLVPTMTSNTTPSGECSVTNEYSVNSAYKVFDGTDSGILSDNASSTLPWEVKYVFSSPIINPSKFNIRWKTVYNMSNVTNIKLQLQDSSDNWIDIKQYTGAYTGNAEVNDTIYKTGLNDTYKAIRLVIINIREDNSVNNPVYGFMPIDIQVYSEAEGITIHSAANDTIYYLDGSTPVTVAVTDANGKAVIDTEDLDPSTYTLYSTVAKNPDNLSNPYTKTVKINGNTTEIYLMPILSLYWWGYENTSLTGGSNFAGWTNNVAGTSISNGTANTNSYTSGGVSVSMRGYGTVNKIDITDFDSLKIILTAVSDVYYGCYLQASANKSTVTNLDATPLSPQPATRITNTGVGTLDISSYRGAYGIAEYAYHTSTNTMTALWLE